MRYALSRNTSNYNCILPQYMVGGLCFEIFFLQTYCSLSLWFLSKWVAWHQTVFYPIHCNFLSWIFHEHVSNCRFCGFCLFVCFIYPSLCGSFYIRPEYSFIFKTVIFKFLYFLFSLPFLIECMGKLWAFLDCSSISQSLFYLFFKKSFCPTFWKKSSYLFIYLSMVLAHFNNYVFTFYNLSPHLSPIFIFLLFISPFLSFFLPPSPPPPLNAILELIVLYLDLTLEQSYSLTGIFQNG